MGVRVDTAGHHVQPASVYGFGSGGDIPPGRIADGRNDAIDTEHIGTTLMVRVDDGTAFNQQVTHSFFSSSALVGLFISPLP